LIASLKRFLSSDLILKSSSSKLITFPINLINLNLLIFVFSSSELAHFFLIEAISGVILSLLFSGQNTVFLKLLNENKVDGRTFILHSICTKSIYLFIGIVAISLLNFSGLPLKFAIFNEVEFFIFFLISCMAFGFLLDMFVFLSQYSLNRERYFLNFLIQISPPIFIFLSIFTCYFFYLDIYNFVFLRLLLIIPILIFSCLLIYNSSRRFGQFKLLKFFKRVFFIQYPLILSGFFSSLTSALPILIFGYINNKEIMIVLGFLERGYTLLKNGIISLTYNLYPYYFKNVENIEKLEDLLIQASKNLRIVSFLMISLSIPFYITFSIQSEIEFSYFYLVIFILRFSQIPLILDLMLVNIYYHLEERTVFLSWLGILGSSIKSLNLFAQEDGLLWVILIFYLASFSQLIISLIDKKDLHRFVRRTYVNTTLTGLVLLAALFV